jgi:hypothetical protein
MTAARPRGKSSGSSSRVLAALFAPLTMHLYRNKT